MTFPLIQFGIEPSPEVFARRSRRLRKALEQTEAPLRAAVRTVMIPSIKTNFEVGGRPKWTPLSEFTIARREQQSTGTRMLDASGKLKREATSFRAWIFASDTAILAAVNFRGDLAVVGAVHQKGSSRTGKGRNVRVPARPYLIIQPNDALRIRALMMKWMGEQGKRFWATGF